MTSVDEGPSLADVLSEGTLDVLEDVLDEYDEIGELEVAEVEKVDDGEVTDGLL